MSLKLNLCGVTGYFLAIMIVAVSTLCKSSVLCLIRSHSFLVLKEEKNTLWIGFAQKSPKALCMYFFPSVISLGCVSHMSTQWQYSHILTCVWDRFPIITFTSEEIVYLFISLFAYISSCILWVSRISKLSDLFCLLHSSSQNVTPPPSQL